MARENSSLMRSCSRMFNWYSRLQDLLVIRAYRELFLTRSWVRQSGDRHRSLCSIWCPLYGARFCVLQSVSVIGHCAAFDVRSTARGSAYCRASPSSVTVQQLMSSSLRRAVLSTAERLRHRSLCSGCCPLYGAQSRGNEYCGEGDAIGRCAVMHPCAGSVFCWAFCRKLAKSLARRLEGQSLVIGDCLYSPPVPRRRFWQSCTFPGLETFSPK